VRNAWVNRSNSAAGVQAAADAGEAVIAIQDRLRGGTRVPEECVADSGLLAAYFFALVVQTLLEREVRQAMARSGEESLPLYPEGPRCARPTTSRLIEVFAPIQRHEVRVGEGAPQVMVTELAKVQRTIVRLLGLDPRTYGLA
jgi:hypothetical protein